MSAQTEAEVRNLVLLMTVSEAAAFGEKVQALQEHYGTATVVATVRKAVENAVEAMGAGSDEQ